MQIDNFVEFSYYLKLSGMFYGILNEISSTIVNRSYRF